MQVPEKLSLIGGSILLASTLIFTLKSQASSIIPQVGQSISNVYNHIGDAQKGSDFNNGYRHAQQQHWQLGQWGSAPFYVDDQHNMYIGGGDLANNLRSAVGSDIAPSLRTLNFQKTVHMSRGGNEMQGGNNNNLSQINGLDQVDTSNAYNFDSMFAGDDHLTDLDLSSWQTSKVWVTHSMFYGTSSLKNLNISNWNTSGLLIMPFMFGDGDSNLHHIDLSNWDTTHVSDMSWVFESNITSITLGENTHLKNLTGLSSGNWKNGNIVLTNNQLEDGQSHPGTWVKQ